MKELPGHTLPNYSEESHKDTLFHYTTAKGLLGILKEKGIRSTAYYSTNDETELNAGKDILTPIFRKKAYEMINTGDELAEILMKRGVDLMDDAVRFERIIIGHALHLFTVYITCFCKPSSKEDFLHGLLSQWRGYGTDGGYALQFSRSKLQKCIEEANKINEVSYDIQDVNYSPENPLKKECIGKSKSKVKYTL